MTDLQELRALAEKCEAMFPSPWKAVGKESWRLIGFPQVEYSDENGSYIPVHNDTDAAYIATFNPSTALSLLDRLEAAESKMCEMCNIDNRINSFAAWERTEQEASDRMFIYEVKKALAEWRKTKEE